MGRIADALISQPRKEGDIAAAIAQATQCLENFTAAFNRQDLQGMDACLHFPHQMWSGAQLLVWQQPGSHSPDFFALLSATGWTHTRYEAISPVLASADKVHFVVDYTRRGLGNAELSRHQNLWMVVQWDGRWGIVLRSY